MVGAGASSGTPPVTSLLTGGAGLGGSSVAAAVGAGATATATVSVSSGGPGAGAAVPGMGAVPFGGAPRRYGGGGGLGFVVALGVVVLVF